MPGPQPSTVRANSTGSNAINASAGSSNATSPLHNSTSDMLSNAYHNPEPIGSTLLNASITSRGTVSSTESTSNRVATQQQIAGENVSRVSTRRGGITKREQASFWLRRVAAGAAAVPPALLQLPTRLSNRTLRGWEVEGRGGLGGLGPLTVKTQSVADRGGANAVAGNATAIPRMVGGSVGNASDPVFMSAQGLRELVEKVEAEEEALANASVIWPRVFILGAAKTASTTLSTLLSHHPQLCAARSLFQGGAAKEAGESSKKSKKHRWIATKSCYA